MAYIQFLGAAGTVTGSKHLVNTAKIDSGKRGYQVLIDCGLFQGQKEWREKNWQDTPIPAHEIDAVVLTHAHLDHAGWVPRLIEEGFRGPIFATPSTVDLCGILLPDSGHLQEEEAEFHNKKKSSKHNPALPLYTQQQAEESLAYLKPLDFDTVQQLSPEVSFKYVRASHILGSAMVELYLKCNGSTRTLLFSGDIGRVREAEVAPGKVVSMGPQGGLAADMLIMESTYGNRTHPKDDPRPELARLVSETVERGGSVVVPAFAVERTQKFLFMLKDEMEKGNIPRIPVYADSPMAIKAVETFIKHDREYNEVTREMIRKYGSPLAWPNFSFLSSAAESKKLNDMRVPMVIVSSSGMVTGGRILHHLMHRLPDPRNLVLFIGFQAPGTRGATIKSGAESVRIFSQPVPIRAQVAALEQFSDHADTPELIEWLETFKKPPQVTYLVHGEPSASSKLQQALHAELGWQVEIAEYMHKVPIV